MRDWLCLLDAGVICSDNSGIVCLEMWYVANDVFLNALLLLRNKFTRRLRAIAKKELVHFLLQEGAVFRLYR